MNALRTVLTREEFQHMQVPLDFGQKFEVIILPIETETKAKNQSETYSLMKTQESSGFITDLYNDTEEDVWNNV